MAYMESDRSSYLRATREVVPSSDLIKYLAQVANNGEPALGYVDAIIVKERLTAEEELLQQRVPRAIGVGIPAIEVYKARTLRSTLFEVRRPLGPHDGKYLRRLSDRLLDLGLENQPGPKLMVATASNILESTLPAHKNEIREFGLELNEGPMQAFLQKQHDQIYEEASRKVGSTQAEPISRETMPHPTVIPIFNVPAWTDDEKLTKFIDQLNHDFIGTCVSLEFDGLEWDQKIRSRAENEYRQV